MDTTYFLKVYFKIVLPIVGCMILWEELFSKNGVLNSQLKNTVLGPGENAEFFLLHRGGSRDKSGIEFYNSLKLPHYSKTQGKNLALKEFMV
jgi:hypothetical protein